MNPERSKLKQHEEQQANIQGSSGQQSVREFATVEDLLRHDAAQTSPPPGLTARVNQSLAAEPAIKPWWRRLFSR